jgi:hypothetical protein
VRCRHPYLVNWFGGQRVASAPIFPGSLADLWWLPCPVAPLVSVGTLSFGARRMAHRSRSGPKPRSTAPCGPRANAHRSLALRPTTRSTGAPSTSRAT